MMIYLLRQFGMVFLWEYTRFGLCMPDHRTRGGQQHDRRSPVEEQILAASNLILASRLWPFTARRVSTKSRTRLSPYTWPIKAQNETQKAREEDPHLRTRRWSSTNPMPVVVNTTQEAYKESLSARTLRTNLDASSYGRPSIHPSSSQEPVNPW